jgi:protein O-mannosyl-transferase
VRPGGRRNFSAPLDTKGTDDWKAVMAAQELGGSQTQPDPFIAAGPSTPTPRENVLLAALLLALVFVAYVPALRCGFVWDDDAWTTRIAPLLRNSAGLGTIWSQPTALQQYYPLSATTFWLDHQLWKLWAAPYHVENVLLHAVAALLFWRILRQLRIRAAWLASALFALHPVMVESVAWITQRKNVLSLVLALAALNLYPRHERTKPEPSCRTSAIPTPPSRPLRIRRDLSYFLAWLLFLAALLAKTSVCSLPAVILLLAWWQRGRIDWRRDVLPTLPFFATALA